MVVKDTYYIGIDIGTQGTKGVLCRYDGTVEADAFSPSQIFRPDAETVYEDPNVIFLSVISVIRSLTDQVGDAKENMTVHRLIASGILYGTKVQGKTFCSKSTLIDYLASEDTFRNPTCEGCKELVRTFKRRKSDDTYNEQRRERRKLEREKKGSGT